MNFFGIEKECLYENNFLLPAIWVRKITKEFFNRKFNCKRLKRKQHSCNYTQKSNKENHFEFQQWNQAGKREKWCDVVACQQIIIYERWLDSFQPLHESLKETFSLLQAFYDFCTARNFAANSNLIMNKFKNNEKWKNEEKVHRKVSGEENLNSCFMEMWTRWDEHLFKRKKKENRRDCIMI